MTHCRICETPLNPFISFGKQPLANGFLTKDEFKKEYFFELKVAFCSGCSMVQLIDQPAPEAMFNDHYAFFSGTSKLMAVHFENFARTVTDRYLRGTRDPFVVEIGSNDGILLRHFAKAGMRHLGVEPSANVAAVATQNGVRTITKFFSAQTAREIVAADGQADLFVAANCMCHIPSFHSIIEGIRVLLKPTGVVVFEDPYLGDVLEKVSYDQIYDEHVFLFSAHSIQRAFSQHGLELIDVTPQPTHGGSMRYYLGFKGTHEISPLVSSQLAKETAIGIHKPQTYETFRKNCETSRTQLIKLLKDRKAEHKRIVGYAATSKSTTVTNYCGITPDLVEFISDTTPIKQGKFSPGMHIPVRPYEQFKQHYPDYALLFGWNHRNEIVAKEKDFLAAGGQWIVYVPRVEITR